MKLAVNLYFGARSRPGWAVAMGAVLAALGFGGDEGGGDAAVKRQAEGLSNPMYQLANLMGQVSHHSHVPAGQPHGPGQSSQSTEHHFVAPSFLSKNASFCFQWTEQLMHWFRLIGCTLRIVHCSIFLSRPCNSHCDTRCLPKIIPRDYLWTWAKRPWLPKITKSWMMPSGWRSRNIFIMAER